MSLTGSAARSVIGSRCANSVLFQFIFVSASSSAASHAGVFSGS
jgi:hypothetical protein